MSRSASAASTATAGPAAKGYSLAPSLTPIPSAPVSGTATPADETAIITRGPDIVSLKEFFSAMDNIVADLERMWKGFQEGRGGAREAGIRDLVSFVDSCQSGSYADADSRISWKWASAAWRSCS